MDDVSESLITYRIGAVKKRPSMDLTTAHDIPYSPMSKIYQAR
jgi:hypothetical protein